MNKKHLSLLFRSKKYVIDFTAGVLPPGVSVTRSTTGTRFNSSGVLEAVAIDNPRFTFNPVTLVIQGLYLESAQTNLILRSHEFDNASWVKGGTTVSANAVTSPDSNVTADKIISNNGIPGVINQAHSKITSPVTYAMSIHAKASEFSWLEMAFYDTVSAGNRFWFNLGTGALGSVSVIGTGYTNTSRTITDCGNGWYRCTCVATSSSASTNAQWIYPTNADLTVTNGNGVSGIYVWGAQMEAASVSSYIPTTSAAITRGQESLILNNVPSNGLRFTFSDNSTQDIPVTPGAVTILASSLNQTVVKRVEAI